MTWLIVIFWTAVACTWIAIIALVIAAVIALYLGGRWIWRKVSGRRVASGPWALPQPSGYLPEDIQ